MAVVALVFGTAAPALATAVPAIPAAAAPAAGSAVPSLSGGPVKTSLAGFAPGNIISDAVFTDKSTMTEAQIQAFFDSKVKTCRGGSDQYGPLICLKDYRTDSVNRSADAYCKGYTGANGESAARIIYRVAQSCDINPQVLIVMLQKEQGLITHTWPSKWRYDAALGQGCPDDAPCNPAYVGFFHQIYGAARQMQIYMEGRYFTWYAPGKTWNILYHPNRGCGTAPVHISNRATAALYYYTPYQPNAAAMKAGYGTGDACSSYGNRNFYNYFTDWFGSTQSRAEAQGLVKVGSAIWLVSGENRYHVTAAAYPEYKRVFPAAVTVTSSVLNRYTDAGLAGVYVKNASTGVVAMIQDGRTHRFASCGLVGVWGGACGSALVQLTDHDFGRFTVGPEMTAFARLTAAGRIHQLDGTRAIPLFDAEVAKHRNDGVVPFAAVLPAGAREATDIDPRVRFLPATFVKASNAPEVWLPDEDGALHHLPSWQLAAELGLPGKVGTVITSTDLNGYKKSTQLSSFVRCGGTDYVAAGGKLSRLGGDVPSGFTVSVLTAVTCAELGLTGPRLDGDGVFMKFSDADDVYMLSGGQYRPVPSADQRAQLNGGDAPTVLVANAAYRSRVSIGPLYPATATFVRVDGTPEVWLVDGDSLVHLPTWSMAAQYGLPSTSAVVPASVVTGMTKRASLTPFATCGDATFVAAGGSLRAVSPSRIGDNPTTALSAGVCAGRTTGTRVDAPTFLGDGSRTAVAVGKGFVILPDAAAVTRAAAGSPVVVHRVSSGYLSWLPAGTVPTEGALVRSSSESAVTLINGSLRMHLPNWGVAADLGVQPRYEIVAPEAIASRPMGGPALSIFFTCGSTAYVGSQGHGVPVTTAALGGSTPVKLTDATCRTLPLRSGTPLTTVRFSAPGGEIYAASRGALVRAGADGATVLPLDARTIAGMLKG